MHHAPIAFAPSPEREVAFDPATLADALAGGLAPEAVLRALPIALYTPDAEGRLLFHNDAAARLWGRRPPLGDTRWCGSWRLETPEGAPLPLADCPMAVALRHTRNKFEHHGKRFILTTLRFPDPACQA